MNNPLHVQIEVNGVKLEIIGNYWPGEAASWDSPGESESVEIETILTEKGDDIGGLLGFSEELSEHIESAALAAYMDNKLWQQAENAILRREMDWEVA